MNRITKTLLWLFILSPFIGLFVLVQLTSLGVFGELPTFAQLENPKNNLATEIISEDGFEEELNEKFLKSLKDLEGNWLDYTNKLKNDVDKLNQFINKQDLNSYIKQVIEYSFDSNKYFNDSEPWSLKKTDTNKMNSVLYSVIEQIKNISILLLPIMPISANKILDIINVKRDLRVIKEITKNDSLNHDKELGNIEILFKKVE